MTLRNYAATLDVTAVSKESACVTRPHFFAIGMWGGLNFGDEVLCCAVHDSLQTLGKVSMMTASAQGSRAYSGLDGATFVEGLCPEPAFWRNFGSHVRAVRRSNLVIIGGGGLINDSFTKASVPRYFIDALLAIAAGKPIVGIGLGVVRVRSRALSAVVAFVCRNAAVVYLRDQGSERRLLEMCGPSVRTAVAPDVGHALRHHFLRQTPGGEGEFALLSLRDAPFKPIRRIAALCSRLLERYPTIILFATESTDVAYYETLRAVLGAPAERVQIIHPRSLDEALDLIHGASAVIAERLHVVLVAAHFRRPLVIVKYESKVEDLASALNAASIESTDLGPEAVDLLNGHCGASLQTLECLAREAKSAVAEAVNAGLSSPRHTRRTRATAAALLALMLPGAFVMGCVSRLARLRHALAVAAAHAISESAR